MPRNPHASWLVATLVVLVSFTALVGGCGDDGPVTPDPEPEPDYFPFSVGSTWTYVSHDTLGVLGTDSLFVSVLTDTLVGDHQAAKLLFEDQRSGPGGPGGPPDPVIFSYTRLVSFEGDWVIFNDEEGIPTYERYRLPFAEGNSWDLEDPESEWHITYEVLEAEDVVVPAGEFESIPVRNVEYELDGTDTDSDYFVDGIGVVSRRSEEGSGQVLVEYDIR